MALQVDLLLRLQLLTTPRAAPPHAQLRCVSQGESTVFHLPGAFWLQPGVAFMLRFVPAEPRPWCTRPIPTSVFVSVHFVPPFRGLSAGASTPHPLDHSAVAARLSWVSPPQEPAPGLSPTHGCLPALGSSWRQRGESLAPSRTGLLLNILRASCAEPGCLSRGPSAAFLWRFARAVPTHVLAADSEGTGAPDPGLRGRPFSPRRADVPSRLQDQGGPILRSAHSLLPAPSAS